MNDGPCDRREVCVLSLVAVFVLVSVIAYADYPHAGPAVELDPLERAGQAVWRRSGCQTCHQLHGFGGFLGPDLTNRVGEDTPDDEIVSIVTSGNGMMPAFRLTPDEQEALVGFLRAMNRTGSSLPPRGPVTRRADPVRHFQEIVEAWRLESGRTPPPEVARGAAVWTMQGCGSCHAAFDQGRNLAPDVTAFSVNRSAPAMKALLSAGRRRMPSYVLGDRDVTDLSAFLTWITAHRAELSAMNDRLEGRAPFSWKDLPWFEYAR